MSETPQEVARRLRPLMVAGAVTFTPTQIAAGAELCRKLKQDGSLVEYKTYINWNGVVMMARNALWDTAENDPDHAPNLWAAIRQKNGIRYIEADMPAELAFGLGDKGWWQDELYESRMEGNVYTPVSAPAAWAKV